jgi:DNA-binding MarR family transcriptional regulator
LSRRAPDPADLWRIAPISSVAERRRQYEYAAMQPEFTLLMVSMLIMMMLMSANYDFERSFGYVLFETARLMSKRFDQRARVLGLTRAQCQLLVRLAQHEGINQARLADLLELEPISLARLIDRTEQAGWIERRADPADRRARLLYMTEKARPLFDQMLELGYEVRAEALAGLDNADRDRLVDLLLHVRGNLSDRSDKATAADRLPQAAGAK